MKRFCLLFIALLFTTLASAQLQKGSVLLGGTIGFENTKVDKSASSTILYITPAAGFFLSNRVVFGSSVSMILDIQKDQTESTLGIQPFVRGYFNERGNERFFGQISLGVLTDKFEHSKTTALLVFGLGLGVDFILNDHVALEAALGFQRFESPGNNANGFNRIGLNIGVAAFVDGKKG